ncbi:MAG: hypothetical protein F2799_04715 [Actinobacteria bacterium]|uniref:Unannotated protein n=1 Tax=freshwater metagenome TaxID=449393 RepID=A0A6J7E1I2_9ZZZZ|nr:hypothetical protein [Actinomycetota bacterium]
MTRISFELPDYLCLRLDRIAEERRINRHELISQLLSGVVDRETERVAAELRRMAFRRTSPSWRTAA